MGVDFADWNILEKEEDNFLLEETSSNGGYETADDRRIDGEDEDVWRRG